MPDKPIDFVGVAKYQRYVQFCVLAMFAIIMLQIVTFIGLVPLPQIVYDLAIIGSTVFYWGVLIAGLVCIILLMVAQRRHVVVIVLLSILMFVPLINLLVLLHVNSSATTLLKARGAKVGLLGVPAHEVSRLLPGHCAGCGYQRDGLEVLAPCPECGRVPEVR